MNALEKEKLIVSWISFHKTEKDSDVYKRNLWAFEKLNGLAEGDSDLCLDIVLSILDRDDDKQVIGSLAAGPVEDLLVVHGNDVVEKIEELASENAAFRHMLGGVWQNEMSDDIWERVRAVSGEKW